MLQPPSSSSEPTPSHILVIDDEAMTRRLLGQALERLGFTVSFAENGTTALDQLAERAPDLIVLDFELPDMDGADLCLALRQSGQAELVEVPIILLTAHSGEQEEVRCLSAGANDFVTKPVSVTVLEARIHTQLRLRSLHLELLQQRNELEEWRRVHEQDLQAAQFTQRAIIPSRTPEIPGWSLATFYRPLIQVGGDVYGWSGLPDGSWFFWIADATGHGASAALLTTLVRTLFSQVAAACPRPSEALQHVNRELFAVFRGRSFVTAACVRLNPQTGTFSFASAGHPPLLLARTAGHHDWLESDGPLLGLTPSIQPVEAHTLLSPGDTALLYTDGLHSLAHDDGTHFTHFDLEPRFASRANARTALAHTLRALRPSPRTQTFSDDVAAIALHRTNGFER